MHADCGKFQSCVRNYLTHRIRALGVHFKIMKAVKGKLLLLIEESVLSFTTIFSLSEGVNLYESARIKIDSKGCLRCDMDEE